MPEDTVENPAPPLRLGDEVDDYCSRCRGLAGHAVSAIQDGKPSRVVCRSCLGEHRYRHGKGGKDRRKETRKLFDQLLRSSPHYKPEER